MTKELAAVVVRLAAGAPDVALPLPVAPIAPEPPVPDALTPVKLRMVTEEITLCDNVAVTVTLLSVVGAKARQTSEVPRCPLVRAAKAQVNPAPETLLTVVFVPDR
jgi:hypothetical protein